MFQFCIHQWLAIIWGVSFIKFTEQSITGVTFRDNFDFEERYRDDHECDPYYWHPLHMPEHCIKQYEEVIHSRVTRSKPFEIIKEKIKPHSYKYQTIHSKATPSTSELNSINGIISYSSLGSANNYHNMVSSNHFNVLASPNNFKHLFSLRQYRVPPAFNQFNVWPSTSKYDVQASANQYYDSANSLDALIQPIDINDLDPSGRRVDQSNDQHYGDSSNHINHDKNVHERNRDYEDHAGPVIKIDNNPYVDRGNHHGDRNQYIDFGRSVLRSEHKDHGGSHHHRDHDSSPRKDFRKRHKKHVYQSQPTYSQESLEFIYNILHNAVNAEHFSTDNDVETSKHIRKRNRKSRSRHRKHARHNERVLLQDHKQRLNENGNYEFIYNNGHDTKRTRLYPRSSDDMGDSCEYQYTHERNYNDNHNDLTHEYYTEQYVDDDRTNQVRRRRTRQNFPRDAMFVGDDYINPLGMESVIDVGSQSSDEEPIYIPSYQSSVQSMLQAIATDVRSQPIAPQIGVLPFLGVSAIYHQPISKNSVDLIKNVALSYQEAAKEQYKAMEKYFPPPHFLPPQPPFPLPDFLQNATTTNTIEYYPHQRKDNKLINKIRHKILENAEHFRKDGENKHKIVGGSSQENVFLRQHK